MQDRRSEVTEVLLAHRGGDEQAFDRLVPMVYNDLRRIARQQLNRLRPGQTLDTTSLVNEVYLKLVDQTRVSWQDRSHFFAIVARAMRQIIIDYARQRGSKKRGSGRPAISLKEAQIVVEQQAEQLVALDEALTELGAIDERLARLVECRFFTGLTEEETAEALGISTRTVQRDWKRARGWLHEAMRG